MNAWRFFRARPGLVNLLAFLACCAIGSGWLKEHDRRVLDAAQYQQAIARAAHWDTLRIVADAKVERDGTTVTKTITKYQTLRDTLTVHDTALVRVTDDVVRSCSELKSDCTEYRRVTDSLVASLRRVIAVREPRTPRWSVSGAALYDPIRQVPAMDAEVGVRVVANFSLVARAEDRLGESPRLYVGVRRVF